MTSRDEDVVAVSRYFVLCLKNKNEIKIVYYADISRDQMFLTCFRKKQSCNEQFWESAFVVSQRALIPLYSVTAHDYEKRKNQGPALLESQSVR